MAPEAYTSDQVAALDEYTTTKLGVDIKQLMEIAGMRSAEIARELFGDVRNITVLAGPGGNGGDALVCAKWLNPSLTPTLKAQARNPLPACYMGELWRNNSL